MIFPANYKCLIKNTFSEGVFSIVPIRFKDRLDIMKWRNEQIYHLRQSEPLTEEGQNHYFENVVAKLFEQEQPNQILFSYLQEDKCIGYGGLVHINWIDKNAEISFIIDTELEKKEFEFHWLTYLSLIEQVAFSELSLHKIFTFAFDLRPHLYKAVEKSGFFKEAQLKDHYFWNERYIDAVIHSKLNLQILISKATMMDLMIYYEWANDDEVRRQSFNSEKIDLTTHTNWYINKLKSKECHFYIFRNQDNIPVGQVRIEKQVGEKNAIIGISIDNNFRGMSLSTNLLKMAVKQFRVDCPGNIINAYIKNSNVKSIGAFVSAGFEFIEYLNYKNADSSLYRITV